MQVMEKKTRGLIRQGSSGMKLAVTDDGALAPLLPKLSSEEAEAPRRPSVVVAMFYVSTSIIGAGIMSIPATLKVLGAAPAIVLIVIVALLVDVSVEFMTRFTHTGQSTTYAGLMAAESFGRLGSVAVQIWVMRFAS